MKASIRSATGPSPGRPAGVGRASRRGAGFTLIEMLIVIGIIGILIGMLFPALRRAQVRARQTACNNTLRQFGLGILQYREDHDGKMPPWLSSMYPDYFSAKSLYVCMSDKSRGQDGCKPDGVDTNVYKIGVQFQEVDDNMNSSATNRGVDIPFCSYQYEYCDTACHRDAPLASRWWYGFLGPGGKASITNITTDAAGNAKWWEVKEYQLRYGDKSHPYAYIETSFPMVRCFYHIFETAIKANDYDSSGHIRGSKPDRLTLNVSYAGNVFPSPIKWEEKMAQ